MLYKFLSSQFATIKLLPLLENISTVLPLWVTKRLRQAKNASEYNSETSSKWTVLTLRQVNMHM